MYSKVVKKNEYQSQFFLAEIIQQLLDFLFDRLVLSYLYFCQVVLLSRSSLMISRIKTPRVLPIFLLLILLNMQKIVNSVK